MKFKPKNDTCGVPGKGFIKAESYSHEDENALIQRAKNRGIDVNMFMIGAGFIPVSNQLEIDVPVFVNTSEEPEQIGLQKRKRRTKAEMEAGE
ncbi:MAG TPA: hypothetical protein PKK67_02095 [Cyclobacteriaceae bacterium]|jgi:hypothetical protein|nr:hypothetical protein [Cyclobacteriaceae bacterium]